MSQAGKSILSCDIGSFELCHNVLVVAGAHPILPASILRCKSEIPNFALLTLLFNAPLTKSPIILFGAIFAAPFHTILLPGPHPANPPIICPAGFIQVVPKVRSPNSPAFPRV